MAKKVILSYITDDRDRRATFKRRQRGLMKMVSELSTLCDVKACAVIYSPYDSKPAVWPSTLGVQQIHEQVNRMPVVQQNKNMFNQETYLRQRIEKAQEQVKHQREENRQKEMGHVMFQTLRGKSLQGLMLKDLNDLVWTISNHLKQLRTRIKHLKEEALKNQNQVQGAQVVPVIPKREPMEAMNMQK